MGSNTLKAAMVIGVGLAFGLWIVSAAFSGGGNLMEALFKYLPYAFAVIGFFLPRMSVYVLFGCGAFLGLLKKFLILDGHYGFDTLYFVVGAPAILLLGACGSTVIQMFLRGNVERKEVAMMIGFSGVSIAMMTLIFMKQGKPQIAIMAGAYVNVVWVMYVHFQDGEALSRLKKFTVLMMAVSALVGYYQQIVGLTPLDLQYVEMGFVSNEEDFDAANPRPFATYGSPGQYGWSMLFGVALVVGMIVGEKRKKRQVHVRIFYGFLLLFFIGAVFTSQKKAPIVALVVFPIAILCIRSWVASLLAFVSMLGLVGFLSAFGDVASEQLRVWSTTLVKIDPNFSVNSFNARIRSFEAIGDTRTIAIAGPGDREAISHSLITDVLVLIGYVPALALIMIGVWMYLRTQNQIKKAVAGWKTPLGQDVSILLGFFLTLLAGAMIGTNAYQAFPGSLFWWAAVGYAAIEISSRGMRTRQEAVAEAPVPGKERIIGAGRPRFAR